MAAESVGDNNLRSIPSHLRNWCLFSTLQVTIQFWRQGASRHASQWEPASPPPANRKKKAHPSSPSPANRKKALPPPANGRRGTATNAWNVDKPFFCQPTTRRNGKLVHDVLNIFITKFINTPFNLFNVVFQISTKKDNELACHFVL